MDNPDLLSFFSFSWLSGRGFILLNEAEISFSLHFQCNHMTEEFTGSFNFFSSECCVILCRWESGWELHWQCASTYKNTTRCFKSCMKRLRQTKTPQYSHGQKLCNFNWLIFCGAPLGRGQSLDMVQCCQGSTNPSEKNWPVVGLHYNQLPIYKVDLPPTPILQ